MKKFVSRWLILNFSLNQTKNIYVDINKHTGFNICYLQFMLFTTVVWFDHGKVDIIDFN